MQGKKGIVWSTIIGIVIASIVIIYVVMPLLSAGYRIIIPRPDYSTIQGFERLENAMGNVDEWGAPVYVPVDIRSGFKITTNKFDSNCVENCICLCKQGSPSSLIQPFGCLSKIYKERCFRSSVDLQGEFSPTGANDVVILEVEGTDEGIQVSGEYAGKCNFDNFQDCMAGDECFVMLTNDEPSATIGGAKRESFQCKPCSNVLVGDMSCERYAYHRQRRIKEPMGDWEYSDSVGIPYEHSHIDKAASQCKSDPCGLSAKGITCVWKALGDDKQTCSEADN